MAEGGGGDASEAAEVRVVRCPKCGKLLAEVDGVSFYRCGGCNATLRAKNGADAAEIVSTCKSNERLRTPDNSSGVSEQVSQTKGFAGDGRESAVRTRHQNSSPASRPGPAEQRASTKDYNGLAKFDSPRAVVGNGADSAESRHQHLFKAPATDATENNKGNRKGKLLGENSHASQNCRNVPLCKGGGGDSTSASLRTLQASPKDVWMPHAEEGPSDSQFSYVKGNPRLDQVKYPTADISHKVEHFEQDRADLLKKLDELRDQLRQSCKVVDRKDDRVQMSEKVHTAELYEAHVVRPHEVPILSKQSSAQHHRSVNGHNSDVVGNHHYPTLHHNDDILEYGDNFEPIPLARPVYQAGHHLRKGPLNKYTYGHFEPEPTISYPFDYYQPACSCLHCCNLHYQPPPHVPPSIYSTTARGPFIAHSHVLHNPQNAPILGPVNHGSHYSSLLSQHPGSYEGSFLKKQSERGCRPFAGGAPFITCYNCSELLQVPQKLLLTDNVAHKMRCGSCSQLIRFEVNGKELIVSTPGRIISSTSGHGSRAVDGTQGGLQNDTRAGGGLVASYFGDYNSSVTTNIQSGEKEFVGSPPPLHFTCNGKMKKNYSFSDLENAERLSLSPTASKDDESPNAEIYQRGVPKSAELFESTENMPRVAGLPLREYFGYSASDKGISRSGTGSRSKRSEHEKLSSANSSFKQDSIKNESAATEMDLPADDNPDFVLSEDSEEASKEEDQPRMSKVGDSFFAGLIKKSFKEFSRNHSMENGKSKVSINGHIISDRLLKKAEKMAGPVQPGEYWYDYRAGFWGVMGQSCVGIIPPFIEEFNYPIPRGCAGGDTGVLVNGRELHQKDLDLLASRGLPTSRDRSYVVEISGRVSDATSGEEFEGLGKLAPTVEKMKHGFGMRVPKGAKA